MHVKYNSRLYLYHFTYLTLYIFVTHELRLSTNSKIIINSQYRFYISAHEAFIIMFILHPLKGHKLVTQIYLVSYVKQALGCHSILNQKKVLIEFHGFTTLNCIKQVPQNQQLLILDGIFEGQRHVSKKKINQVAISRPQSS